MAVLMCHPKFFNVLYNINPWMSSQIGKVNNDKAVSQWFKLIEEISKIVPVHLMSSLDGLPDMVFTANAGFIYKNTAILSKFKYSERTQEEEHFRKWFELSEYNVVQPKNFFEGEGDLLVDSQKRHWIGTGFRTDELVIPEIEKIIQNSLYKLELVDARWYHLDTCFCPLTNGELLWYPEAFSTKSQKLIKESFDKTIEVTLEDALLFACNAVCIENNIFMPKTNSTGNSLNNFNYTVKAFDLDEFQKSGGSAKCLVLHCR